MRTALRIALWNFAFFVCLVGVLALAAVAQLESVAFGLPTALAVWVLVQGAVFAQRRCWVVACAATSSLLLLLQLSILAFFAWWNRGFRNNQMETLAVLFFSLVLVCGVFLIGWFLRAKRGFGS